jgi:hypothetical protein
LEHGYRFSVSANASNYLGTLYIAPQWGEVAEIFRPSSQSREGQFSARYRLADTQQRDKKWAEDVIPAMGKVPSLFGHLDAF